jgi:hypothetical protein
VKFSGTLDFMRRSSIENIGISAGHILGIKTFTQDHLGMIPIMEMITKR